MNNRKLAEMSRHMKVFFKGESDALTSVFTSEMQLPVRFTLVVPVVGLRCMIVK